jgi:hypothetical protein
MSKELGTFSTKSSNDAVCRNILKYLNETFLTTSLTLLMETEINEKITQDELFDYIQEASDKLRKSPETIGKIEKWASKHDIRYSHYHCIDEAEFKELIYRHYNKYLWTPLFEKYIEKPKIREPTK